MKIKANQIYYTVETIHWCTDFNRITSLEFINKSRAELYYKELRKAYLTSDELTKSKTMYRLAKVQNGQSITLACCGYGVMDNFSFADDEPNI